MKNNLVQQIGKPVTSRNSIPKYIKNIGIMSNSTANEYYARLTIFEIFVSAEYRTTVDDIIKKIKEDLYDPYDVLSNYSAYLSRNKNISSLTVKQRVVTAKNFLEYHDVDISPRKFKLKVKLPKVIRKNKEALSKEDIVDILNACSDIEWALKKVEVNKIPNDRLEAVIPSTIRDLEKRKDKAMKDQIQTTSG